MLELFKDEIPEIKKLISVINEMISDPESSLEDIREAVSEHIVEQSKLDCSDPGYDDLLSNAENISFNVIDDLIYDLDVSDINCNRILSYLSSFVSYSGYDRLLRDFRRLLPESVRSNLLREGRNNFIKEVTDGWD